MEIPSPIKCPICKNNMVLPDPKVVKVSPFVIKNSDNNEYSPPDDSTVRICLNCGNVQQFIHIENSFRY